MSSMEALQARLESFSKPKRVKHASSKRTVSVKWPHPDHFFATPNALAEAGFYFSPSWDDRDNVACFLCEKELSGWVDDDDPFVLHWDKCRDHCAWALVRCGMGDGSRKGKVPVLKDPAYLPTGKTMVNARLTTFRNNSRWPHDLEKGHGASSSKMAKAGFVYTPQVSGDDTATCFFCNTSLSGWDAEDEPLEEHLKREKKLGMPCPFFSTAESAAPASSLGKSTTRAPSSRASTKPPSRAGSKKPPVSQQGPSDASSSESESDLAGSTTRAPAPRRALNRSTSTSSVAADSTRRSMRSSRSKPPSEPEEEASGSDNGRRALGRSTRGKTKGKAKERIEAIEEEDEDEQEEAVVNGGGKGKGKYKARLPKEQEAEKDTDAPAKPTRKPKVKKEEEVGDEHVVAKSKAKVGRPKKVVQTTDDEPDLESKPKPKSKSKSKSKPKVGRPKKKVIESDDGLSDTDGAGVEVKSVRKGKDKAVESAVEESQPILKTNPRAATKSKSKAIPVPPPVMTDSNSDASAEDSPTPNAPVKPEKHARNGVKTLKISPPPSEDAEMDDADDNDAQAQPPPSPVLKKPSKTRAKATTSSSERGNLAVVARKQTTITTSANQDEEKMIGPTPRSDTHSRSKANGSGNASSRSRSQSSKTTAKETVPSLSKSPDVFSDDFMHVDVDETFAAPQGKPSEPSQEQRKRLSVVFAPAAAARLPQAEEIEMADVETMLEPSPVRAPASPFHLSPSSSRAFLPPSRSPSQAPSSPSSPHPPPPASSSIPTLSSRDSDQQLVSEADAVNFADIGVQPLLPAGTILSEEERKMTIEQWIQKEIEVKAERVRVEIEKKIAAYKEKVEDTRRRIEAL